MRDSNYVEYKSSLSAAFKVLYLKNLDAVNYVICKDNWMHSLNCLVFHTL